MTFDESTYRRSVGGLRERRFNTLLYATNYFKSTRSHVVPPSRSIAPPNCRGVLLGVLLRLHFVEKLQSKREGV